MGVWTAAGRAADRVSREPVLLGAAVQAQLEVAWPHMSPAARVALGAWVALFQRAFSRSKRTADEQVEQAKYQGAVEHQAVATAGQLIAAAQAGPAPEPPPPPPLVVPPAPVGG